MNHQVRYLVGPSLWIKEEIEEKGREKRKYELHGRHMD
jgi:hypothetical protein